MDRDQQRKRLLVARPTKRGRQGSFHTEKCVHSPVVVPGLPICCVRHPCWSFVESCGAGGPPGQAGPRWGRRKTTTVRLEDRRPRRSVGSQFPSSRPRKEWRVRTSPQLLSPLLPLGALLPAPGLVPVGRVAF